MPVSPMDIERRIKALRGQARQEVQGAPYAVYALVDPGSPDEPFEPGPFNGTPFHVGQKRVTIQYSRFSGDRPSFPRLL